MFETEEELKGHTKLPKDEDGKCKLDCWVDGCQQYFAWERDRIWHIENHHWYEMCESLKITRCDSQTKAKVLSQPVIENCQ